MKRIAALVVWIAGGGSLTGCIVVAAAALAAVVAIGTYKYVNNELHREYEVGYERAWDAAIRTPQDMQFHGISHSRDYQRGTVRAYRADERPVVIILEKLDERHVLIKVRVGTFESEDNRQAAQAVHEKLYDNMGGKPPK